jgi:hypothetical protein
MLLMGAKTLFIGQWCSQGRWMRCGGRGAGGSPRGQ